MGSEQHLFGQSVGAKAKGASSWWGTTNRQPPLAFAPTDWKLMLL